MSGEQLKTFLKNNGVVLTDLAEKLGDWSLQRVCGLFNAADVKSGILEKIAEVYGKDMGWYYGFQVVAPFNAQVNAAKDNGVSVMGDNNSIDNSDKLIALLEEKDRQINTLLEIIKNK